MRSWFVLACVLQFAAVATAQKMGEQIRCRQPDQQYAIPVGDAPGHVYSISHSSCTYPKPGNIGVSKKVGGEDVVFSETTGTRTQWHGVYTETMSNGEKLYYRHQGGGVLNNGTFTSGEDAWEVSGGTGSYKAYRGKGVCKLHPQPDGTFLDDCSGEYTSPK